MKRTLLISAALALTLLCSSASAQTIVPLFHTPAQHHPKMPVYHPPRFVCSTDSLGDSICCIHKPLPGWWGRHGWGTWECTIVPAAPVSARR